MAEQKDILTKVLNFIDSSDDYDAIDLVSELYYLYAELSNSASILIVENKLLNRELDEVYDGFSEDEEEKKLVA